MDESDHRYNTNYTENRLTKLNRVGELADKGEQAEKKVSNSQSKDRLVCASRKKQSIMRTVKV